MSRFNPKDGWLFSEEELTPWKAEWQNMPEYYHQDEAPKYQVLVSFSCYSDLEEFSKLIDAPSIVKEVRKRKSVWFPESRDGFVRINKRYRGGDES